MPQPPAASVESESVSNVSTQRPRRRWLRASLVLFGLLVAAAWFAPEIVSQTSLRQRVVDWATAGKPIRIELGSTSLGWLKPVVTRDLQITDGNGHPLLVAKEFRSEATLWQLATQRGSLGTFTLVEPVGNVVLRADGSNVEDLVAAFSSGGSSAAVPEFRVEIVNARIDFDHSDSKRQSTLDSLDLKFTYGAKGLDFVVAELPSRSASTAITQTGRLAAYFGEPVKDAADKTTTATTARQLLVRAKDFRLDWLNPVVARWQPRGEVAGMLSADWQASLDKETSGRGELILRELNIAGLNGMKADRLQLSEVSVRGRVATKGKRLVLDETELRTEVGTLTASGDVPVSGWSFGSANDLLQKFGGETFRVDGEVDLAKLAALLPQTLAVREGTRIDGGSVRIVLASQPQDGHASFQGKLEIDRLSAVADGRRLEWNVPLQTLVMTHRDGKDFVFDRVTCRSDFLQAEAKGTLTDATFQLTGDLDRLHHNLSRFFDWGIVRLSGQVTANGQIQRRDAGELELRAKTVMTNFELQRRGETSWREARLEVVSSSTARLSEQQRLRSVESASLRLISGEDRLDLKLSEPLDWTSPDAHWRAVADVVGGLESWQARLRPVVTVEGWQVAGQLAAHAEVAADSRAIVVSKLTIAIDQLQARGPEWLIQEPKLSLETAGRWETATSRWVAPHAVMTGTTAAATVDDLNWSPEGASGDARFRVHVGNVSRWKVQAQQQPRYFVAGEATGSLRLQQRGTTTQATLDARVEKFAIATPNERTQSGWETAWQEPQIKLATLAVFDSAKQSLKLNDSRLTADGLEVDLAGQLDELGATPLVDLTGQVAYDWDRLTQRLSESLRQNVQLAGQERRKFALRGRLSSPEVVSQAPLARVNSGRLANVSQASSPSESPLAMLTGEGGLGWKTANLYGLSAGAGDVSCKLTDGVGVFALRDLPVNEGTVRLNSQLRLDRSPAMIVLQSERVIDKVRLSPELCAGWLKFVAPLMADATRVDGRFSVVLANGALPISDPASGDVAGQFAVHEAQIAPGPLGYQILAVTDRIKALTKTKSLKPADLLALAEQSASSGGRERVLVTLPEQQVPFRLINGRVHHEGLTLVTKEATLKTRGSVGLDESLELVVEVPVRDEWIAQNKQLARLRGKSLSIPVRGSLSSPQLDLRVFEGLAREAITAPVENLLESELQKGLNRLLPGKKK